MKEVRFNSLKEVRIDQSNGTRSIEGYAALYNSPTDLGGYREVIKPGAFTRALKEQQDVRALINHDPNMVLGRSTAGTLQLSEDDKGLKFRVQMPDTSYSRDLMESMSRGDINQCSFGFEVVDQSWTSTNADPSYVSTDDNGQNVMVRELRDMNLLDVSCVTYPAYPETSVGLRSLFNAIGEPQTEVASGIAPEPTPVEVFDAEKERMKMQLELVKRGIPRQSQSRE